MTVLLLEPHLQGIDDAVLFATYTLLRERPMVVTVCSNAHVQERYGIDGETRRVETLRALRTLGRDEGWRCLGLRDDRIDVPSLRRALHGIDADDPPSKVWAPLPEDGGHEDHNIVGNVAREVFGDRVRFYATYRRGSARTRTETEVTPEPHWPALKFKAMACYESQINLDNTRPWFAADDALREWIA